MPKPRSVLRPRGFPLQNIFFFPCENAVPCHFRCCEPATDAHPAFFARPALPSFSENPAYAHRRRNHTALKRTAEDNLRHGGTFPQCLYKGDTRQRRFYPANESVSVAERPKPQRPGIALPLEFTRSAVPSGFRPQNSFNPAAYFSSLNRLGDLLPPAFSRSFSDKE